MEENIENIWLQVKSFVGSRLQENQVLDNESEKTLKQQITSLAKKESPVRQLMWKRLLAYVRLVKTTKMLPPAPPGFSDLNDELQALATAFKRITIYNYSVFGEHLEKMLDELSASTANSGTQSTDNATTTASSTVENASQVEPTMTDAP